MEKDQGFLLIEVLIALFLITTASFVLLNHQLQLQLSLQKTANYSLKTNLQNNNSECQSFGN